MLAQVVFITSWTPESDIRWELVELPMSRHRCHLFHQKVPVAFQWLLVGSVADGCCVAAGRSNNWSVRSLSHSLTVLLLLTNAPIRRVETGRGSTPAFRAPRRGQLDVFLLTVKKLVSTHHFGLPFEALQAVVCLFGGQLRLLHLFALFLTIAHAVFLLLFPVTETWNFLLHRHGSRTRL